MSWTRIALAFLAALLVVAVERAAASEPVIGRTGVVVTPRNFPDHTADDVVEMFRLGSTLGGFTVARLDWSDPRLGEVARVLTDLARQHGLDPVLELNPLKADELNGAQVQPPRDVSDAARGRSGFSNPLVAEAFGRTVMELAALRPAYLALATDVNLLQKSDPAEFAALAAIYRTLYARVRQASPGTRVYVTFQWDALQHLPPAEARRVVDAFGPVDVLAIASEPRRLFDREGPEGIRADYYARAAALAGGKPLLVTVTWPSAGGRGEREQEAFVNRLPALMERLRPAMLAWSFLHDVRVLMVITVRNGLLTTDGKRKPAFAAFQSLGGGRTQAPPARGAAAIQGAPLPRSAVTTARREPDHYAIYTSRLDGGDVRIVMSDPQREMTHPRVSPDRRRIVLTRYNKRGSDGRANEDQGYDNTEIVIANLDGTGVETIVPPKPGVIAANGDWVDGGKALIYISTDNPKRVPEILRVDLETRRTTRLPTPAGFRTTDPHWHGGQVVFPVKAEGRGADALWIMNEDGSGARQITRPRRGSVLPGFYGDFDPRLSPDGSRVAFMRIDGGEAWKIVVLDLKTGREQVLTPEGGVVQGLPTWSSDGRLLLYRHIDRRKPKEIGLYTMTPDGHERRMVPLPRGILYNHGSFFPGEGSGPEARIIFTGTPMPGL